MRAVDLIARKREGGELTGEEMEHLVRGFLEGTVADYQMAAFLMAVCFRGMSPRELTAYTAALVASGPVLDWSDQVKPVVDKHSSGGVGDKTTLVLVPLLAAAGLAVPKMSGRSLGHTGGTVDKLESIPGFKTELDGAALRELIRDPGLAVVGQSRELAPADGVIYSLRDVTATVESIPLIAASIMSKKIASGAQVILLDVKAGRGAFMKTPEQAVELAETMVELGRRFNRRTVALVTDMSQPLGRAVGNALEVYEAVETLQGEGPPDLVELVLQLGGHLLAAAGKASGPAEGAALLEELLQKGEGWRKFAAMVKAQGGDLKALEERRLPEARFLIPWEAPREGYIHSLKADLIGRAAALMGAGRSRKEEAIDPAVGLVLDKKVGDPVDAGERVGLLHLNQREKLPEVTALLDRALVIQEQPVQAPPLVQRALGF
ncbi:MAG: thymidine phosphorylase [Dethiobacteria bacterium]|jgi:pyrimidine-nucleoside phosphorylase|nr:thymidine phosphorylase [Bacillota bacterium]HOP68974.1 thymidine phosphorylase [Bacillota bacterium]HPT33878.1 thymidine phosphorylase [Bacillota bacterium]HPZ64153.1 thymidine phosphorylase [Bacillota bacterium]HQD05674.1 thymidine phosphorylase [Bacillota bacterium]